MWQLGPAENEAVLRGVRKRLDAQDRHRLEVALCAAWHVAAWNASAKVGKLDEWAKYRAKLFGAAGSSSPSQQDWRARKREREEQMKQLTKRQKQRVRSIGRRK